MNPLHLLGSFIEIGQDDGGCFQRAVDVFLRESMTRVRFITVTDLPKSKLISLLR